MNYSKWNHNFSSNKSCSDTRTSKKKRKKKWKQNHIQTPDSQSNLNEKYDSDVFFYDIAGNLNSKPVKNDKHFKSKQTITSNKNRNKMLNNSAVNVKIKKKKKHKPIVKNKVYSEFVNGHNLEKVNSKSIQNTNKLYNSYSDAHLKKDKKSKHEHGIKNSLYTDVKLKRTNTSHSSTSQAFLSKDSFSHSDRQVVDILDSDLEITYTQESSQDKNDSTEEINNTLLQNGSNSMKSKKHKISETSGISEIHSDIFNNGITNSQFTGVTNSKKQKYNKHLESISASKKDAELFYFDLSGNRSHNFTINSTKSSQFNNSVERKEKDTVIDMLESDLEITYESENDFSKIKHKEESTDETRHTKKIKSKSLDSVIEVDKVRSISPVLIMPVDSKKKRRLLSQSFEEEKSPKKKHEKDTFIDEIVPAFNNSIENNEIPNKTKKKKLFKNNYLDSSDRDNIEETLHTEIDIKDNVNNSYNDTIDTETTLGESTDFDQTYASTDFSFNIYKFNAEKLKKKTKGEKRAKLLQNTYSEQSLHDTVNISDISSFCESETNTKSKKKSKREVLISKEKKIKSKTGDDNIEDNCESLDTSISQSTNEYSVSLLAMFDTNVLKKKKKMQYESADTPDNCTTDNTKNDQVLKQDTSKSDCTMEDSLISKSEKKVKKIKHKDNITNNNEISNVDDNEDVHSLIQLLKSEDIPINNTKKDKIKKTKQKDIQSDNDNSNVKDNEDVDILTNHTKTEIINENINDIDTNSYIQHDSTKSKTKKKKIYPNNDNSTTAGDESEDISFIKQFIEDTYVSINDSERKYTKKDNTKYTKLNNDSDVILTQTYMSQENTEFSIPQPKKKRKKIEHQDLSSVVQFPENGEESHIVSIKNTQTEGTKTDDTNLKRNNAQDENDSDLVFFVDESDTTKLKEKSRRKKHQEASTSGDYIEANTNVIEDTPKSDNIDENINSFSVSNSDARILHKKKKKIKVDDVYTTEEDIPIVEYDTIKSKKRKWKLKNQHSNKEINTSVSDDDEDMSFLTFRNWARTKYVQETSNDESDSSIEFSPDLHWKWKIATSADDISQDDAQAVNCIDIISPYNNHDDIPVLHRIKRASKPTPQEMSLARALNAKIGAFSKQEDQQIRDNWNNFCKVHRVDFMPSVFFKFPKSITTVQKIKFLHCLTYGLTDRIPFNVHERFKRIYRDAHLKFGRFTPDEDKKILKFMSRTSSSKPFHDLGLILNRTSMAVERRYAILNSEHGEKRVEWNNIKMTERVIHGLFQVTGVREIEELERVSIKYNQWQKLSTILDDIPVKKIKRAWYVTIHPKLFAKERDVQVRRDLIKLMLFNNEQDYREVNWERYAEHFEGVTAKKAYDMFIHMARWYVPKEILPNLRSTLLHLSQVYKGYKCNTAGMYVYKDGKLQLREK